MTTKEYMHTATAVDGYWLAELGPMFFRYKMNKCNDSEICNSNVILYSCNCDCDFKSFIVIVIVILDFRCNCN